MPYDPSIPDWIADILGRAISDHSRRVGARIPFPCSFDPGDIVTRDGTDRHVVVKIGGGRDTMLVRCVLEPAVRSDDDGTTPDPWTRLGEEEWNLCRRYQHAEMEY